MIRSALAWILVGCSGSPNLHQLGPNASTPGGVHLPLPKTYFAKANTPAAVRLKARLESVGATQDQPPAALEIHLEERSSEPQTLSIGAVPMGPPAWIGIRETEQGPAFRVLYGPNGLDDAERGTLEQVLLDLMQETTTGPPNGDPAKSFKINGSY